MEYYIPLCYFVKSSYLGNVSFDADKRGQEAQSVDSKYYCGVYFMPNQGRNFVFQDKFKSTLDCSMSGDFTLERKRNNVKEQEYKSLVKSLKARGGTTEKLFEEKCLFLFCYVQNISSEEQNEFLDREKKKLDKIDIPIKITEINKRQIKNNYTFDSFYLNILEENCLFLKEDDAVGDDPNHMLHVFSPFETSLKFPSTTAHLRKFFSADNNMSEKVNLLLDYMHWGAIPKSVLRSFYVFDDEIIIDEVVASLVLKKDLPDMSEKYPIDVQNYVGKSIGQFATTQCVFYDENPISSAMSLGNWRIFFTLLNMHICNYNLLDSGLASVELVPASVDNKTFSMQLKFANTGNVPIEFYFENPSFSGIKRISFDEGKTWRKCIAWQKYSSMDNKSPERVLLQPQQNISRIISLREFFGDLPNDKVNAVLDIDLYARPMPPGVVMDVPEPFGARIKTQINVRIDARKTK